MHKPSLLKRMGIKAVVTQLNQRWLAKFGVIALSLVMLVQMMLCDTYVEISNMYDNDDLEGSPPHLYLYLVLN